MDMRMKLHQKIQTEFSESNDATKFGVLGAGQQLATNW
jgi:hypothetical protein